MSFDTEVSGLWLYVPAAQLGKHLFHLAEDLAKHWRLLDPHSVGAKAEAKPPGAVKGVLLILPEAIKVESIFIIIILVVIMCHGIEEGVPDIL